MTSIFSMLRANRQRGLHRGGVASLLLGFLVSCTGTITDEGAPPGAPGNPQLPGNPVTPAGAGGGPTTPPVPGTAGAGTIGGADDPGAPPLEPGTQNPKPVEPGMITSPTPGDPTAAGVIGLRYFTSREYLNTVRDLLGETSLTQDDVPNETGDPTFGYFPFRVPGTVGNVEAELLQSAAEQVVKNLGSRIDSILPCQPSNAGAEASCATQFISTFGPKAYRRPLDQAEIARLNALYQKGRAAPLNLDFKGAIGLVVEGILQSPGFYYRWEKDPGAAQVDSNGKVQLGPYMLANRLSYFLYGSMPDQALFDAAGRGQLGTDREIDAQARRMLNDPKARVMVADFISDLLDLEFLPVRPKDESVYSMYNATLQEAMQVEAENFATNIILSGSGKFDDLMTSTATSLNQPLAALYGVSGISGQNFREANWNAGQRGGLLTLAAFLANTGAANGSDPPRRGKLVFTRFLCTDLPPPPNEIPPVAEATPGVTTRQRFEEHGQLDCARGCHGILDNIGFAFEHFDGVGAHRATDMGAPVDASGSFAFDDTAQVSYTNALEFQRALVASAKGKACMSTQWLRYAFRRQETSDDLASLQATNAAFVSSGNDIRELIVALAKSRAFRFRTPSAGEVL